MARKLKSDRVLFTTTILLVALSVVMVYSASAPVALERYGRASLFLIKQGMWALLGVAMLNIVMRIDYRAYRQPAFLWTARVRRVRARRRLLPRARQRRAALVRRRRHRYPAVRARQARRDLLHRGAPRAADAPHRRRRVRAPADRHPRDRARRADPAGARFRHVDVAPADRGGGGGRRGPGLPVRRRRRVLCAAPPPTWPPALAG